MLQASTNIRVISKSLDFGIQDQSTEESIVNILNSVKLTFQMMIIIAATLVGFVVVGTIYFNSANTQTALQERQLETTDTVAAVKALQVGFLLERRNEKDFLLRSDMKYVKRHAKTAVEMNQHFEHLRHNIHDAEGLALVDQVEKGFKAYVAEFQHVAELRQKVGLKPNEGFTGVLRKAVNDAEVEIKEHNSAHLMASVLMLRRHEKDYFLRLDPKYVKRLDKGVVSFKKTADVVMRAKGGDAEMLHGLADAYKTAFAKVVETKATEVKSIKIMSSLYAKVAPVLAHLVEVENAAFSAATEELRANSKSTFMTIMSTMAVVSIVVIALGLFIALGISRPIQAMTSAMRELAGGNKEIEIPGLNNRNEIGEMAKAVQVFKDTAIEAEKMEAERDQNRTDREARAEAERQEEAAANERRQARQTAIDGLTGKFGDTVETVLEVVSTQSSQMQTSAETMSSVAQQTLDQSIAVSTASEQATASVQTVATAAEELSASISEISRQVSHSTDISQQAVAAADGTNQTIRELAEGATRIGEVVNLINDIANQTNLLALNATIEAARAGDAGKGFAVVASEVKNLASQTARATEDISAQIGSIQSTTQDAVGAIEGIGKTISEMNEIATTIASAVEEQGAATSEISRNVQEAAQGTQNVTESIVSVKSGSEQTGDASGEVLTSASQLAREFDGLRNDVEEFLKDIKAV
jgi:methyl-accepting chemotaxis protein